MAVAQFTLERRRADQGGQGQGHPQRLMVQTLLSLTEVRDRRNRPPFPPDAGVRRGRLARQLATHAEFRAYLTPERIDLLQASRRFTTSARSACPIELLNKPGALTADEFVEMRKHPGHGRDVIVHAEQDVGTSTTMRFSRWPRTSSTPTMKSGTAPATRRALRGTRTFRLSAG
jgi:response regulator RpfG family c-di-GMP phosphodiesterase